MRVKRAFKSIMRANLPSKVSIFESKSGNNKFINVNLWLIDAPLVDYGTHKQKSVSGGRMRNIFTIAAVSVLSVTTAVAETAPGNVAFEDGSVMASLTGSAGDAAAGRNVILFD